MNPNVDAVSEQDLQAYVDGELSTQRMMEVENYLSQNPAAASAMMTDLRNWNEVRLAYPERKETVSIQAVDAARRLERGFARQRWNRRFKQFAFAASLIGIGWLAHAYPGSWLISRGIALALPPAYVADAVQAYKTTQLRLAMRSQIETSAYDATEILNATKIIVPDLPHGWEVADVQMFPSSFGPSLQMAIQTPDFGLVTLFAVRSDDAVMTPATLVRRDDLSTAYWQVGNIAYALIGKVDTPMLATAVGALSNDPNAIDH